MITPEEFPYIPAINVKNCYAYQNFDIRLYNYKPFSHLILTGKNGSGKTTILNAINNHLNVMLGLDPEIKGSPSSLYANLQHSLKGAEWTAQTSGWRDMSDVQRIGKNMAKLSNIHLFEGEYYSSNYEDRFHRLDGYFILFTYFEARRKVEVSDVTNPTKESEFINALVKLDSGEFFNKNFQQYLVNKRVSQAFDRLENREEAVRQTEDFFDEISFILRKIFDDQGLTLRFVRERFETPIKLSDGREVTLKQLPSGYSGLLRIVLDLLIRVDLIRSRVRDSKYDPCGIVLIDEPEAHLHIELQEQILPVLSELFPNIQFIVATHSPAVIASIKNATIFDLTTKDSRTSEETVGRSYSELTTSHFGLENDYSTIADEYLQQIDSIMDMHQGSPAVLKQQLENWRRDNAQFLSPTLQVKLEYIIAQQDAKLAVAQ